MVMLADVVVTMVEVKLTTFEILIRFVVDTTIETDVPLTSNMKKSP